MGMIELGSSERVSEKRGHATSEPEDFRRSGTGEIPGVDGCVDW